MDLKQDLTHPNFLKASTKEMFHHFLTQPCFRLLHTCPVNDAGYYEKQGHVIFQILNLVGSENWTKMSVL